MKVNRLQLLAFPVFLFLMGSCNISKFFQQKYYKDSYFPIEIGAVNGQIPEQHFIEGITCFSYETPYCQSASLQMVHSLSSESPSIHFYNWIMGFTYGAYFHDYVGVYSFLPSTDPELGLIQAEDYVGYKRKYFISDDATSYQSAMKDWIAKGKPLRVALNSATMSDEEGFYPHSVLVVGYDKNNVIYYETGAENRTLKNHGGERMSWEKFLKSVESISEGFNYPWKYQFTSFETDAFEGPIKEYNHTSLLKANGYSLGGDKFGPVAIGAKAFESLAAYIEKNGLQDREASYLTETFQMGKANRLDNAMFLKASSDKKLLELSDYMNKSSELFSTALTELESKNYENLKKALLDLYKNENQAGQLILNQSS